MSTLPGLSARLVRLLRAYSSSSRRTVIYDFAIVGGGIIGLSTGLALTRRHPHARLVVLEKESGWAHHQSGHNSGVIHSGIYYKPGSLKAKWARQGNLSMVRFCQEHGIQHEVCGKVIVATRETELGSLQNLYERGLENGLQITRMRAEEVREIEPHVACLAGIRVPSTGIVSYRQVCLKYAEIIRDRGASLRLDTKLEGINSKGGSLMLETNREPVEARLLINCAGLFSDRVARLARANLQTRIVPFRGEYYELTPQKRHLVKTLVYPVPDPRFPFLGVHFTRTVDGGVHAGPNAVLSLKREGYGKTDFESRDFAEIVSFPGFWRLAGRHAGEGMREVVRSFSKAIFVRSLQRLVPEIEACDLVRAHAGVRAQAVGTDGRLVDDFLHFKSGKIVHVCNAPSPAATASIEIGNAIAELGTTLYQQAA